MSAELTPEERRAEVDRVARLLMAEWERVEEKPVGISFVATFADMARAVIRDRAQSAPLTAEVDVERLLSEHRIIQQSGAQYEWACTGEACRWRSSAPCDYAMAQHRAHQAEVIARAQATAVSRAEPETHWVGDAPTSLHGNGAGSFEHTTRDEAKVTCRLCLYMLARDAAATRSDTASEALDRVRGLVDIEVADTRRSWVHAARGNVRCLDCDLRYEERQDYGCRAGEGHGHHYPEDWLTEAEEKARNDEMRHVTLSLDDLRAALGGDPDHSHGRQG